MTITEQPPVVKAEAAPVSPWRRWLAPATFAVFGLVDIFVLGLFAHPGDATFAFSQPFAKVTVPNLSLPATETCYVCGAISLALAARGPFVPLSKPLKAGEPSRSCCSCSCSPCCAGPTPGRPPRSTS